MIRYASQWNTPMEQPKMKHGNFAVPAGHYARYWPECTLRLVTGLPGLWIVVLTT